MAVDKRSVAVGIEGVVQDSGVIAAAGADDVAMRGASEIVGLRVVTAVRPKHPPEPGESLKAARPPRHQATAGVAAVIDALEHRGRAIADADRQHLVELRGRDGTAGPGSRQIAGTVMLGTGQHDVWRRR